MPTTHSYDVTAEQIQDQKSSVTDILQIFIDNEWHDAVSGKTFDTVNPATETVNASVAEGT